MTRNRDRHSSRREGGDGPARGVGILLTLALLAPATAVLVARARGLADLESSGPARGCSGLDIWGPILQAGLPTVALLLLVPGALLSLAGRARGWIWLALALAGTVLLDLVVRSSLPGCL